MKFDIEQDVTERLEAARSYIAAREIERDKTWFSKFRALAGIISEKVDELVEVVQRPAASRAEKMASEILPLAAACQFVGKHGRRLLAAQRHAGMAPWWLGRVSVTTLRQPWGVVLVLAPSNYPLMLSGIQIVQAIAAGNAVLVKPAVGAETAMEVFKRCLTEAGLPSELLQILSSDISSGETAMRLGVDKVFLTGSADTGRAVQLQLAGRLTPATMELSGCDAVFLAGGADLSRAAQAIAFALRLNGGATCIAPRRVFVEKRFREELCVLLKKELADAPSVPVPPKPLSVAQSAINQAVQGGAEILCGRAELDATDAMQPVVLTHVRPEMMVARSDIFAPVSSLIEVKCMEDAIEADRVCPYHLGASIFGSENEVEKWRPRIYAGCVVVNDIVVPTADPRVAFGGYDMSGYGVTRGAAGLLEMTRPQVICERKGNWLPHLNPSLSNNAQLVNALLQMSYAPSWMKRLRSMLSLASHFRKLKS